jgi:hypothetical protein
VTGVNCGLPHGRRGAGRPRAQARAADHPAGPRAFIDVVTDIDPPFVINNESGWYEGRMIHDATVPAVGPPRSDGHASASDHFPDTQTNVVPIHLSMGAYSYCVIFEVWARFLVVARRNTGIATGAWRERQ